MDCAAIRELRSDRCVKGLPPDASSSPHFRDIQEREKFENPGGFRLPSFGGLGPLLDPARDSLSLGEQARVLHLLVERVTYDGADGTLAITFRPTGIKALAEEREVAAC